MARATHALPLSLKTTGIAVQPVGGALLFISFPEFRVVLIQVDFSVPSAVSDKSPTLSKQDYSIFRAMQFQLHLFTPNFANTMTFVMKTRFSLRQTTGKPVGNHIDPVEIADDFDDGPADDIGSRRVCCHHPEATALAFPISADAPDLGSASRSSQSTILARASSSSAKSFRSRKRSNTIHASVLLRVSDSSCQSTTAVRPDS